ncbi:hypothetical protein Pmani_025011 [Petrolisthes manimaculis]|uniref:Uncharacterized protein n=1 Tax=Petrolisthes manimaculis TaxID=1843537 RepID=A0AAE1P714_9EUCA|nr:hypothetical protein Pmani_025011 [Petrolisthes manimaculis]
MRNGKKRVEGREEEGRKGGGRDMKRDCESKVRNEEERRKQKEVAERDMKTVNRRPKGSTTHFYAADPSLHQIRPRDVDYRFRSNPTQRVVDLFAIRPSVGNFTGWRKSIILT